MESTDVCLPQVSTKVGDLVSSLSTYVRTEHYQNFSTALLFLLSLTAQRLACFSGDGLWLRLWLGGLRGGGAGAGRHCDWRACGLVCGMKKGGLGAVYTPHPNQLTNDERRRSSQRLRSTFFPSVRR